MHTDARTLEDGATIEGDLCIIGAGAAGISMALEWIGEGQRVVLLEGGGFEISPKMQSLYQTRNVGRDYYPLRSARLHLFGGTTHHWGGLCAPLDPIDFQDRSWVPNSGWPLSRSDLTDYYRRAGEVAKLPSRRWAPTYWAERREGRPLPTDESRVQTKMWQHSGGAGTPVRFGPEYRTQIEQAEDVHLFTHANVCNLSANEAAKKIEEVTVRHFNGDEQTVRAPRFVLACGAVQNARLLLASDEEAPEGLGNERGLVGRYFMEHLEVDTARLALPSPQPFSFYRQKPSPMPRSGRSPAYGLLRPASQWQREEKTLNGAIRLNLKRVGEASPYTFDDYPSDARKIQAVWKKRFGSLEQEVDSLEYTEKASYRLNTRIEQVPNPDSRVTLTGEEDALGVPRTSLNWKLSEQDRRSIRAINRAVAEEIGRLGLGRVQIMDWLREDKSGWPDFLTGGWHHMGTTRMADGPERGVVDPNCKVFGLANLYVAGSSVFPTGGCANPTLTLMALSLRLSDHIKEKM